jgi:hypothetical protein
MTIIISMERTFNQRSARYGAILDFQSVSGHTAGLRNAAPARPAKTGNPADKDHVSNLISASGRKKRGLTQAIRVLFMPLLAYASVNLLLRLIKREYV